MLPDTNGYGRFEPQFRSEKEISIRLHTLAAVFAALLMLVALPATASLLHFEGFEDPAWTARSKRDAQLRPEIERVWNENFQVYGVRKVWRQLAGEAIPAARCTIARLMAEMGLSRVMRGRRAKTTVPVRDIACPQDRVQRAKHDSLNSLGPTSKAREDI